MSISSETERAMDIIRKFGSKARQLGIPAPHLRVHWRLFNDIAVFLGKNVGSHARFQLGSFDLFSSNECVNLAANNIIRVSKLTFPPLFRPLLHFEDYIMHGGIMLRNIVDSEIDWVCRTDHWLGKCMDQLPDLLSVKSVRYVEDGNLVFVMHNSIAKKMELKFERSDYP